MAHKRGQCSWRKRNQILPTNPVTRDGTLATATASSPQRSFHPPGGLPTFPNTVARGPFFPNGGFLLTNAECRSVPDPRAQGGDRETQSSMVQGGHHGDRRAPNPACRAASGESREAGGGVERGRVRVPGWSLTMTSFSRMPLVPTFRGAARTFSKPRGWHRESGWGNRMKPRSPHLCQRSCPWGYM